MAWATPKEAWDKLKEEFQGTERTRQQQLLNLRRDFENLKMKEEETVKQYSDRIMAVVNSIRLIGEQFSKARIVEKVISTLPERYEEKISSLEDSRDLTTISLTELINALYAQEQRRASRLEEHQEGVFQAKAKPTSNASAYKSKKTWRDKSKHENTKRRDQHCRHCKRAGHLEANYWFRPDVGWINHMSPDVTIFKTLDRTCKTKVKVENGQFIKAEGKGDVLICTPTDGKVISNVLLVPEIDRNLLSIAQLLEKGYSVVFKEKECKISNPNGSSFVTKSKVAPVFLKFKFAAETETSCKLKTLRLPTKALAQKTPFEAWFGFKPSLAHLRTFGCTCYAQVPAVKRRKLDKKAQVGISVGYNTVKNGYKILDPSTNKILVNRDVVFNEKASWNWEKNEPEAVSEYFASD
ncbi:uncharacterized protein [Gossypium hirsutum]|uniref:Retrovirus-related Pol polyprotein from transposon TNT 1-94 n=1 Tax=Gossypium hirsutum TaxID=3635 RepID=A0A1U8MTF7_GOSHI|nr:uncharacterized protein LOC107941120 [Gossypium hirsutum]